jgi:hypothetical protein
VDRKVARFLRTQRKNLRRFFQSRGMLDLYDQMEQLRKQPNRGFMQKNRSFQRIMNEYIASTNTSKAASAVVGGEVGSGTVVGMRPAGSDDRSLEGTGGDGEHTAGGVQDVATRAANDTGVVIEE